MRAVALAPCKNGGDPQNRQRGFASVPLDETPTMKIYEMSGERSWRTRRSWRSADVLSAREGLDEEHGRAAVPAHEGGPVGSVAGAIIAGVCGKLGRRL